MEKIYDLIIVGTGPAGLAAAIYGQRAQLDMLVLEKNYMSGGQVLNTYEVDNYPGLAGINGFDMGTKFREHAEGLGAEFRQEEVLDLQLEGKVKVIKTAKEEWKARTILLTTGAHHRLLDVPGEKEYSGMGVSYCATCDGAFFRNKTVAVIGGGDVAVEDAIFLARGCEKVYVIHRRDELRAARSLQSKLLSLDNVELVWDSVVEEIRGDEIVSGIAVKNVKTGEVEVKPVNGVFIAVGINPNDELFRGKIETDEQGYIVAGEEGRTNIPGVFAAGDVRTKALRQIITAASDGANAVWSVQEYLNQL